MEFLSLKMGLVGHPETSVRNYHSTLYKIPEKRKSQDKRCIVRDSNRDRPTMWPRSVITRFFPRIFLSRSYIFFRALPHTHFQRMEC